MSTIKEQAIQKILELSEEDVKSLMEQKISKSQMMEIYNKMKLQEAMQLIASIKDGDEYDQVMEGIEELRNKYLSKVQRAEKARKAKK